jgi:uncharacterized repeat protein (TIGR01451 family)
MGAKGRSVCWAVWLSLAGLHAQTAAVPWSSYAHGPQHTGLSTIASQRLEQIKWSTAVDLAPPYTSGATLYIHYGSPLVTAANTILLPVRTSSSNTYQVQALSGANGSLLYTLSTTYAPLSYSWIPPFGMALSEGSRLYYPGSGGTVYYRDQPDSPSGPSGQIAFYGNSVYSANQSAFNTTVMISTPITADANGNIYFGFEVTGSNPENLASGLARIGADGTGSWISASAAAQGDTTILEVAANCAPAVSNDGKTLYFAVSEGQPGTGFSPGYLVSVDSTTLAPIGRIRLIDPETGNDAIVPDQGSASPTVGPDNDVYYGVLDSDQMNDDRGWLLHFDQTLTTSKTPGAFGWDDTASVVPASPVPSYTGTSSYLLFTKYNNYMGAGPGRNGHNKIAVLDPNAPTTDPITGATVMQEVITILGPTLSPAGNPNGSVREWCINSGAIDPFAAAALANSEDGTLYHWDFAGNSFTQKVPLTNGVSEAYTPTVIGADGTVYAINDATLFAVGQASNMTITSSHSGNFTPGETGAVYMLTATNSGTASTNGIVTVTDILPSIFSAQLIGGSGWNCTQPAGPCSRADSLGVGASYPNLTLTVDVLSDGLATVTNVAEVSADGAANTVNTRSNDVTDIIAPPANLTVSKAHSSNFTQGQVGATYTVTVSNAAGAGATNGTVTVTESVPPGLSLYSMMGTGWNCQAGSLSCSRTDSLPAGASYSQITVTVNVANNAASSLVNQVNVSYGGWMSASAPDTTVIISPCAFTNDGSAGVADLQKVINEALGAQEAVDDLNSDGVVNAVDVQIVINAVIGLGCTL